ncbi:MAG: c-type cytochrome [Alphaproteobacteria bacterium]|nr:c-type cytochrome [Alphaproteobacteria bacterium]
MPAQAEDIWQRGRDLFEPCRACHAAEPGAEAQAGPNLAGLIGREVGGDPGFDYSPVLADAFKAGLRWDEARLDRFLADPEGMFPGFWMAMRGIGSAADRTALIRFLARPAP